MDALSERTNNGNPLVRACEGEHWEGGDYNVGNNGNCQAATATEVAVNHCGRNGLDEQPAGAGDLGVRASKGAGVYVGVKIGGVGHTAVWADQAGHVVWYGHDDTEQLGVTCAVWGEEDCNMLASIIHDAGITRGSAVADEENADCSQNDPGSDTDNYEKGSCARDNTAIGVKLLP